MSRKFRPFVVVLLATVILPRCHLLRESRAADPVSKKPGDAMIEAFLAGEADKLGKGFLDGAKSKEEWEARRPKLKQELLDMLGLWPLPDKTPLHDQVTGTLERDGDIVIEKLHFQSRPGLYVTGNLYRPKSAKGRLPAVLYVCGHTPKGRDGNKTAFQDHGMWFARNGYVCLLIDTLQLGEVAGVHHGTYNLGRFWWQAAGYTPAGVECWNGVRAIDYLVGRPDVDAKRLAVTGISGGGATTFWIAAADDRVTCAVPVSGMSDLESYVNRRVVNEHCDCMFMINFHGWAWTTIAALLAPRPLLFANSNADQMFPMDGNRRVIERLRTLYAMYGKTELVADHVSQGGHDYRPDLRVAIFAWINKHLKDDTSPVKDATDPPIEGKRLRAFPEDKDLPTDALNSKIDETFVGRAKPALPASGTPFADWKGDLLRRVRDRSFRALPERVPFAKLLPRSRQSSSDPGAEGRVETNPRVRRLSTEPGIEIAALDLREDKPGASSGTLVVLNPGDGLRGVPDWAKPFADKGAVVVVAPRGIGSTEWTRVSPPNFVTRAHALVGRTSDDGRVWDIAATVRWLGAGSEARTRWRVVGKGEAGVLAAYAAIFEPAVSEVIAVDPPSSHVDGPLFLGVLRVMDTPTAFGLVAPTPLTVVNARDRAFEQTERIYDAAGAKAAFKMLSLDAKP